MWFSSNHLLISGLFLNNFSATDDSIGLVAFGLNHKTAPVEVREKVSFAPENLDVALQELKREADLQEVAILSTCNRTEFYCATNNQNVVKILNWISYFHRLKINQIQKSAYEFWGHGAVRHMMRVASGLDSMVLGEPQILGQMKTAYTLAKEANTLGPELGRLFQSTFSVAKQIRTETNIGVNPVSVASAAVSLAKHIFSDLSHSKVLLIGAGETVELLARHLKQHQVKEMIVANRTLERAEQVASEFDGVPITLEEIPDVLRKVDIVVSSTAAPLPILGKGMVEKAIKRRRHSPIFMIDIAVPRDIEPEVGDLDDVYLYTVDDLQATVEENRKEREKVALEAEKIVDERSAQYMVQMRELGGIETIKSYRAKVEALRASEMQKALKAIESGADPVSTMERMSRALTNKVMHEPSLALKKASAEGRVDLLKWSHELFGIDDIQDSED